MIGLRISLAVVALMQLPALAQTTDAPSPLPPVSGLAAPVVPKGEGTLTLAQAISLALQRSPELFAALREREATEGAVLQAGARLNPALGASVEDTRSATRTTTIQVSQPIELGGKRAARVSVAERARDQADAQLLARRADVRASVVTAFFEVLTAQERIRLAQASVELAESATRAAANRVIAGKVSPVEETKARVAEAGVRVERLQADAELRVARQRLSTLWGDSTPHFERAEGSIAQLPEMPSDATLADRLRDAPSLRQVRLEVERRRALVEVERARRIPDLTLTLGAKRDAQLGRTQAIIGFSVPLPLLDTNRGNLAEALSREGKARDELAAAELRAMADLVQASERLRGARAEAETLQRDALPGARSAYEAANKGFQLGKFSFLETLDAQRTLFQVQTQYLRALAESHRAAAEIDRLVGDTAGAAPAPIKP